MEQDPSLLEEETVIREHTRKKKGTHEDLFKSLKVEKVVIPLPEEDQTCPVCGTQMVLIGEEYVRRELEFIPATCKVIEYYSQSYGCPSCKEGLSDTEKPGSGSHTKEFLEGYNGYLETDAIRGITICRGSGAAPVGHISADTLLTLFPKASSMITASRQCRESSTATGYSPLRTPLTKSIPVIMKSGNSCVSRRKNLFWRLSGRGSISRTQSGIRGWIKRLIMFSTDVIRQRPIWKTGAAVLPTILARMRSVHLP